MPDTEGSKNVPQDPNNVPATPCSISEGNPPPDPRKPDTVSDQRTAQELDQIRKGEGWLIKIGIASVIVNTVLGWIYWQQLGQMRIATKASADAVQLATETLDYSNGQFERNMRQVIDQTESQYVSAKATRDALSATIEDFRVDERPYLSIALTGTPAVFQIIAIGDQKGKLSFAMPVQNFGKTPGVVTGEDVHIAVGPDDTKNVSIRPATSHRSYIIDPGDKTPVFLYSRVIAPNAKDGEQVTYPAPVVIYGSIEYTSVFEKRKKPYVLAFCSEIAASTDQRNPTQYCNGKNYIR